MNKKLFGAGLLSLTLMLASCSQNSNPTKKDTTLPTVSVTAISAPVTTAGTISLSATASDNVAIKQIDFYDNGKLVGTDTSSPYSMPVSYTAADNGTHTIKVVATDTSGNTNSSTSTVTVNIPTAAADTTKPVVTSLVLTPSTVDSSNLQNVVITGTATDNVGVKTVNLSLTATVSGQTATIPLTAVTPDSSGNFSYTITPAMLGQYASQLANVNSATVTATATDAAGNVSDAVSKTLTITHGTTTADTTNPTVAFTGPTAAVTAAGATSLTATASDNVAIKQVDFYDNGTLVGSSTTSPYSVNTNYTAANNGTHTIKVVATDTSGNTASSTGTVTVNIAATPTADTTKPVITGLTLTPNTISSTAPQTVVVTGKATDNVAVKQVVVTVSAMGGVVTIPLPAVTPDASGNFSVSITPASLGQYASSLGLINSATISAVATDTSGNASDAVTQTLTITH